MQEVPVVIDSAFMGEDMQSPDQEPIVDDVSNKASDVIKKANEEAAQIIAQAKMASEQCLSQAQQEATSLKQQAHEEGRQQGCQEGKQEGYQEGLLQGKQTGHLEMEQVIAEAVVKTQQMFVAREQEAKDMMFAAERQIIDIALAVARKIIAYEIAENPMVVLPLVKAALQKVSDQEEVVIRVSVDDFDSVLMAKKDLQTMVGKENGLKIIVDQTIKSGSCIIGTSYGEVDATIDTQFETIKKALQGVA